MNIRHTRITLAIMGGLLLLMGGTGQAQSVGTGTSGGTGVGSGIAGGPTGSINQEYSGTTGPDMSRPLPGGDTAPGGVGVGGTPNSSGLNQMNPGGSGLSS